ncbi:D-arabinono-1,4-lactone oxidase [Nocardioides jiangxiensis]|uniref:D-arabinono-1,4-lactone oxidase n=1 Tax=Nocardioides jiangxiensis TaxID=3064524 RepID=A0ABT9B0T9_9ACTN|nr:D-arabinono-1,4-lactone oxidase [Nocardioides sp. WY-20]MDO7867242.1 D-arabinono-1,4-lactone oxidase [Nocardioides sp. WY-20]
MWRNWTGDQVCTPRHRVSPASVDEVASVVVSAAARGDVVRVVGAGHAFGDNVVTDGTLVSLDRLSGLLDVDPATGLVRVAAGTRLYAVNELLDAHGLALANLGDINVQSVAGAISTATHGTGAAFGNLATFVESMEIVTAAGDVVELDGDDLRAGRVSVGALGVVTAYTLRTVPAFRLRERRDRMPLVTVLRDFDAFADGSDHFEFFVFPYADRALTKQLERTQDLAQPGSERRAYFDEVILENKVLDLICRAGRRFPSQVPRLNRLVTSVASPSEKVNVGHKVFSSPREVRFTESEWAFPREVLPEVLPRILRVAEQHGVNFPIEVRVVAADSESMLSPSYGRATAYVAVHAYQGMPWQAYFAAVQAIGVEYAARPHWGKRHTLDAAELSGRYPEWDSFQAVRRRLDPAGVFANDHVRRIFG